MSSLFFPIVSWKLRCDDEDIVDGVICILKFVLLKPNYSSGASLTDTRQMDPVISLLLNLLDVRDSAAKAIVMLIAEYCSMYTLFLLYPSHSTIIYFIIFWD